MSKGMKLTVWSLLGVALLAAVAWWSLRPVQRPSRYPHTLLGLPRSLDEYGGKAVEELDDAAGLNLPLRNAELLVYRSKGREIRLRVGYTGSYAAAAAALTSLRRARPIGEPLREGLLPSAAGSVHTASLYFQEGRRFFWVESNFRLAPAEKEKIRREVLGRPLREGRDGGGG